MEESENPKETDSNPALTELEAAVSTVLLSNEDEPETPVASSSLGEESTDATEAKAAAETDTETVPVVAIIEDDSPRLSDRFVKRLYNNCYWSRPHTW